MSSSPAREQDDLVGSEEPAPGWDGSHRLPPQPDPGDEPRHLQVAPVPEMEPAPRYPARLPVTLCWGGQDRRRTAVDVSGEGLFVETPDHPGVGDLVQVVLRLPRRENLRVLCSVERVVVPEEAAFCGGMPGMGLRFFLMDSRMRAAWGAWLDELSSARSPFAPDPQRPEHLRQVPLELTRRSEPRRDGRFSVRVRGMGQEQEFQTEDISSGGLFVATDHPADPGTVLRLFVVHPVTGREIALDGRVRWTRGVRPSGPPAGMGVQILSATEEDAELFLAFLNRG